MKNILFLLSILSVSIELGWSQCVPTCSNYVAVPITYTTFPIAGTNAIPQFVPNTDDGVTPLVSIGFNFNFYCTNYTQVWVCSNGFIQFNNGFPAISTGFADPTQPFPSVVSPNAMVALDMNDLDPGSAGMVTYTTVGTSPNQMFIVTYTNVPIFGYATSIHSGQIVLYETTNIIDIYTGEVTNLSTTNGTQGIENATGSQGLPVPGRDNVIWNSMNTAYRFLPVTPLPPASVSGSVLVCEGTQNLYTSAAALGATSYTWTLPSGWNGTSSTTALSAMAGASGNVSVAATYTCGTSSATTISVTVNPAPVVSVLSTDPFIVCEGTTFTITPSGATSYTVYPSLVSGSGPLEITNYGAITYSLVGSDANNCLSYNTATTVIESQITPTVTVNSGSICLGQNFTMLPNGANSYIVSSGFLTVNPNAAGVFNYSVTGVGTGTNFCQSLSPAISSLTVNPNPIIDITTPRTTICKDETITLTASGATSYSWTNIAQTNATISVSPASTITYSVTGTTAEGCSASKIITIIVSQCVGINDPDEDSSGVLVYPNPANGVFNLKFEGTPGSNELEVYNTLGQLILSQKNESANVSVDITQQPDGLYYLKLKGTNKTVLKIIKE